jgi:hypothetical protein
MLYFPTHTLAAIENDRLRTAARYRLLARVRREQAAPDTRRRRPRWQVFRVSSMTGSAS